MAASSTKMVLVHGSWGGASAWELVVPALADRGVDAIAVELPGRGPNGPMGWRVSLADYGDAINAATDGEPAVVVGHSAGGVAITQAACSAAAPHAALVYLAAYLPVDGDRLARIATGDAGSQMKQHLRPNPFRGVLGINTKGLDETLYHDYEGADVGELLQRLVPEPLRPGMTKVKLTQTFHDSPKYYIQCAHDRAVSPALQEWMCSRYDLEPSAVLDTGHMPNRVAPDRLADALTEIMAGVGQAP